MRTVTHVLAKSGYNITSLSADIDTDPPPNLHYLYLDEMYNYLYTDESKYNFFEIGQSSTWNQLNDFYHFGDDACKGAAASTGWQQLLNYPDTFKVCTLTSYY